MATAPDTESVLASLLEQMCGVDAAPVQHAVAERLQELHQDLVHAEGLTRLNTTQRIHKILNFKFNIRPTSNEIPCHSGEFPRC